jgi:hypothetical protein
MSTFLFYLIFPSEFILTNDSRGMKAEFDNPLYQLSPSAHARAALPIDHPEYSPTAACPPKLLFPQAHSAKNRRRLPDQAMLPKRLTLQKELELLQKVHPAPDEEIENMGHERVDPILQAMGSVRR